jgi:transposase-like protein
MSAKEIQGIRFDGSSKSLKEALEEAKKVLLQDREQDIDPVIGMIGCPSCGCGMVIRTGTERVCPRCHKDIYTGSEPVEK